MISCYSGRMENKITKISRWLVRYSGYFVIPALVISGFLVMLSLLYFASILERP